VGGAREGGLLEWTGMSLLDYERRFSNLKMNVVGGAEKSPHKVAMLLAVIELIEKELITENRIKFDVILKAEFSSQFSRLAGPNDRDNPHLPFFHLRSSGFWKHHLKPGMSEPYSTLNTASGPGVINDHIAFAYLDDELMELLSNGVARELLKAALHRNLSQQDRRELLHDNRGWDWLECELIVADYFVMLNKEVCGEKLNKAEHYRNLMPLLNGRNRRAIESKHRNITAILLEMGQRYITGLSPLANYQRQLKKVVQAYIAGNQGEFERLVATAEEGVLDVPTPKNWDAVHDDDIPELITSIQEPKRQYLARKTNFSQRERNNRVLGEQGEAFVIAYERYRLERAGRADLAREIQWSSKKQGDGLGYDVRSFNHKRAEELFIEVKTTSSGKYQPFFISENEVSFSKDRAGQYCLYRVFDFKQKPQLYKLPGAVDQHVHLQAQSYKASFN
jgi:Protein NO VEIN, C-terminal